MKTSCKLFLIVAMVFGISLSALAQENIWSPNNESPDSFVKDKAVARPSFPKEFKLFNLNVEPLRQQLMSITDRTAASTVISLPNADGLMERFEIFEASNFEPKLQAQYPEIRAFSGQGLTDRYALLKLSISPQGIQTIVFRAEAEAEAIEAYSEDRTVYAVFRSRRDKGQLPWTCSTQEKNMFSDISSQIPQNQVPESDAGQVKTMRLAQSCNGEYSNFFGAFNPSQVALVLAAYNGTLTRANGVYEKDLAIHLNLIAQTTAVIYYDPATDPYTNLGSWNNQLAATLAANIGEANYDIGHMFGASGGGGNAGCIGCVCVDGQKGRGITSPADGIPQGDNFDIDYVVHEVGHQMGANHTFSMSSEGTGRNKEVGSGITIMGYAGITSQDVAPHSIDIFHQTSIEQIQANMAPKTCPVTTVMTVNAPPVITPIGPFTIPISTAFALTGVATDPQGDPITYNWEQNDNSTTTGAASVASPTKLTGPNWLSFPSTISPTRSFPRLSTILAGLFVTPPFPGGDTGANIEALSSVARTLNFRLTVRDNNPYVPGVKIGQTKFSDTVVTVSAAAGPFKVTSPNTAGTSYPSGSTQTVTWDVANTTAAPINVANVRILISYDGGQTFPVVLAENTANDGTESVTMPNVGTTTGRIKVESIGNIFFDIGDANFTLTGGPTPTPTATSTFTPTPTASATNTGTPSPTPTNTNTNTPTNTPTQGPTPCGVTVFSYTGPAVAITDNVPAGTNFTIPVSGMGTISDVNFRFDGTQSADPASTTPGLNHSWVGDMVVRITSPSGTTVAAFDRPGVPASTFGCASNNLAQLSLDDDGGLPSIETQCGADTNAAFPTGTFSPNNLLSAFDGQNANGNWVINISDNAAGDTGSARAFSLVIGNTSCGTPTATATGSPQATATATSTVAATATATASGTPGGELLVIDATTSNQITITATTGVSAETRSGSTVTGFYFQNLFANAGTFVFGTDTLVSGNLTAASVPTDNSPDLFRLNNTDPGLNVFSYSATATTTFTAGQLAFTGVGTWTITPAAYAALLTAPTTGNVYFPADDIADLPTAVVLGTYRVILPGGATPTATSTGTPPPTSTNTATPTASPSCTPSERIADGTFEAGTPWPLWTVQTSTNFDTPLCNTALCGTGGGAAPPFAGDNWAWFGGVPAVESATLGQTVTIPAGTATLSFQMRVGTVVAPFTDTLVVSIDGTQIASFTEPATAEAAYTLRTFDVSAFANGGQHSLLFTYNGPTTGTASFTVDNVSITSGCGPVGTPTATSTGSPQATATSTATATATATATGTPSCGTTVSYTGPAVAITDNVPAGTNFTIPVSGVGTVSDVNFRFDGTQSADPASTTPGMNHSWVGDIVVRITSPGGTTVAAYDRPGVPTTTFGCASNNLAQLTLDDDGGFPSIETQCGTDTNAAFPTGTFSPNNPLSAFDGQNANGNWVINISDNAAGDTGSARAFSLVFGGACGTPTATSTVAPSATATATSTPSGGTSVQFSSATYTEDESQVAAITVNRTGDLSGTSTVNFATSNGTATGGASCASGVDYISVAQAVTFNPGVSVQTVNIVICSDTLVEPSQTVNLTLTGAAVGSPGTAVLNINDVASAYRASGAICTTFSQPGSPYPSTISVAGGPSSVGSVRVTLFDLAATIPDSMDFLLVGPTGQKFILMADAGGILDLTTPVTLTFSDTAGQVLPNSGLLTTGVFEPTSWEPGQTNFPAPAPAAPYNEPGSTVGGSGTQTLLGNFGTTNGNGTWSLYVRDDGGNLFAPSAITGCVNGGWGLELFASTAANASVSGRVLTADGLGIRNAKVVVTGDSLIEPITVSTGSFGYFTFDGLATGATYVVTVNSQRYTFSTPSQVVSLVDNVVNLDFVADPAQ